LPIPTDAGVTEFVPIPLDARRFELTALGANVELDAGWDYPLIGPEPHDPPATPPGYVPLDLVEYQHTAALGRDHFVRTLTVGYLCGTGHRAVIEATVERLPDGVEVVEQPPAGGAVFGTKGYLIRTAQGSCDDVVGA
jgi:hypothetical protein